MKRILAVTALAILLVLTGASIVGKKPVRQASATLHADEGTTRSLATVAGKYGFTRTGTLLLPTGPGPGGGVGRVTLEAEGSLSGAEARNVGGGFADETFTGTATLSPNCTATSTLKRGGL